MREEWLVLRRQNGELGSQLARANAELEDALEELEASRTNYRRLAAQLPP